MPNIDHIEPIAVSPAAACKLLSVSMFTVYKLLRSGELESFTAGRSRKILVSSIRRYIESKPRHRGGRLGAKVGELVAPAA
jgi:excisionase family DNA binding protein